MVEMAAYLNIADEADRADQVRNSDRLRLRLLVC